MRITFFLSSLQLSGGVLLIAEYANRFAKRGYSVTLVLPQSTFGHSLHDVLQPDVQIIESRLRIPHRRTLFSLARLSIAMARAAPRSDFLFATHTPTAIPALLAARLGKGKALWLYMDYDEMFRKRAVEKWILQSAPRCFSHILTISSPLAERLAQQTQATIFMTSSGIPRAELLQNYSSPFTSTVESSKRKRRVLYVGDSRPRKGLLEFLQAAHEVAETAKDLQFVVVSKMECKLPTDLDIEFHLHPSDLTLAQIYHSSDLFVSASWGEGLGYPPLEAMICGVPVVLTDSTGVRDWACHEENCLMVLPRQPQALGRAMLRVLTEPALAHKLAQNGAIVAQRYTWEETIARTEAALMAIQQETH